MTPVEMRDTLDEIVDDFTRFPGSCRDLLLEKEDAELLLRAVNAFLAWTGDEWVKIDPRTGAVTRAWAG